MEPGNALHLGVRLGRKLGAPEEETPRLYVRVEYGSPILVAASLEFTMSQQQL
jgi:hypothetical protein